MRIVERVAVRVEQAPGRQVSSGLRQRPVDGQRSRLRGPRLRMWRQYQRHWPLSDRSRGMAYRSLTQRWRAWQVAARVAKYGLRCVDPPQVAIQEGSPISRESKAGKVV